MPKTFKHSGDLGDIIFSLPAIRALGGGILYLDPEGGLSNPLVTSYGKNHTKINDAIIDSFKPILIRQPYIVDVLPWHGEQIDHDLDEFRRHIRFNNLSDSHLAIFGLSFEERDRAWLTIDDPITIPDRPIVISRTPRYHGNDGFWVTALPRIKDRCVFLGFPKEHEMFVYTFDEEVTYYPTADILTLARVIAGAEQFIGNQGFIHSLAEAMKKDLINETDRCYPAAMFQRKGAQYV